jgi:hypothetical protein
VQLPWIRTAADSREFAREFFRIYAQPRARYVVELCNPATLPKSWDGRIRLQSLNGSELIVSSIESIRVQFDHMPLVRIELGPPDPRDVWPMSRPGERWQIPTAEATDHGGDLLTFSGGVPSSECALADSGSSSSSDSSSSAEGRSDSQLPV